MKRLLCAAARIVPFVGSPGRLAVLLGAAWGIFLCGLQLQAQEVDKRVQVGSAGEDGPGKDEAAALSVEAVEAQRSTFEADSRIDGAVKDLLRPKYSEALELAAAAREFAVRAAAYQESILSVPGEMASLRETMARLPSPESLRREIVDQGKAGSLDEPEVLRATLTRFEEERSARMDELARIRDRPLEISRRLPEARKEHAAAGAALAAQGRLAGEISPGRAVERLLLALKERKVAAEMAMLDAEQRSHAAREELLEEQVELLDRQVEIAGARLDRVTVLVDRERQEDFAAIRTAVRGVLDDQVAADSREKALAEEVLTLLEQSATVTAATRETGRVHDDLRARRHALAREDRLIRSQLKLGRAGGVMAQRLFEFRQGLPGHHAMLMRTRELNDRIGEARLAALEVEEARLRGGMLEKSFGEGPAPRAVDLLGWRKQLLDRLDDQYGELVVALGMMAVDEGLYLDEVSAARAYLDEKLFWMRSSPPVGYATLRDLPAGVHALFRGGASVSVGGILVGGAKNLSPGQVMGWLLLGALVLTRRRVSRALETTGARIRRISTDRYGYTFMALLWTCVLAIPLPLACYLAGALLGQVPDAGGWLSDLGRALQICSVVLVPLVFMIVVCRPAGLGAAHFKWRNELLGRLRWAVRWFTVFYLSAFVVLRLSFTEQGGVYFDSVGRISFIVVQAVVAAILWKLFRRRQDGLLTQFMDDHPGALLTRSHGLWARMIAGIPLALIVLACFGYLFTAQILTFELLLTAVIIQVGVIAYWTTLRWFMIRERRLALAAAIEERESRREAAARSSEEKNEETAQGTEEVVSVEIDEEKIDLSSIGQQTRDLLRSIFVVAVVIAVGAFWSKTVPMISALDGIRLDGGGISLFDLVKLTLVAFVTVMASRNLPGLLELAVLGSMGVEAGTRTAIVTLCRYLVVAIGLAFAFQILAVDWAKFGWIAAALSVGLGFGLQEVVANFVCGLVILFERPIRVGDIVTVEGMTGTVSRIRMRATTIINWDRQEFVVPNKNFVTGTILNWTLSNAINRMIVAVGVAYGTDTERARQILLEVAADHPLVLEDPAPLASFEEFADSSLTLRLRVYLPNLDDRIKTLTELHAEIDRRFAAAGIEISFPQRDLHIRDWSPPVREDLGLHGENSGP